MDISAEWIIGFAEGEGCFSRGGNCPYFSIAQSEKEVIEKIRDYFGFGHVYERHAPLQRKRIYAFYTQKTSDLLKLIPFFEGKLITIHKQKQFEKWKPYILERASTIKQHNRWTDEENDLVLQGENPPNRSKINVAAQRCRLRKRLSLVEAM